ncbi:mitochondrial carrier protein-like protein [Eremomyces bilateralis CBS 781.70]|uniref:Mitochondrial carrier protein-like protein n=1 Tax=Eremomyces bilateralis CBS 781.70 TaxID=1392243 RepID=A0A6G1G107_9PEZI|nr:mitochondrial carrier protein-like protein [Eremomyces bilateralis CBS 781.70]KAF1811610.1 mitochondrial carrier protein-like protein [Eremomyces bilateralis CBS 781.70]
MVFLGQLAKCFRAPDRTAATVTDNADSNHPFTAVAEPAVASHGAAAAMDNELAMETARPQYLHAMLAGGLGGTTGDMLMHSLDTVKTRQQGDPHMPPKYTSMGGSYYTIFRQEGFRGLYGGVAPAFLGSFSGTVIFFGTYEWSKRLLLDSGMNASLAYLSAGFIADLAASPLYVPSEVLKTRLQLQGRHNNPYFKSGYNYRSMRDAVRTIYRGEGLPALFYGYKATLIRDLPFSALQFAFYEQERAFAQRWMGSKKIGLPLELLTGASAGGMAGVLTCPLDVVKTRIQTQHNPSSSATATSGSAVLKSTAPLPNTLQHPSSKHPTSHVSPPTQETSQRSNRPISTSSPSTTLRNPSAVTLDTSSVMTGLRIIYRTEGFAGWFRGVGPRFVWTSVQSGTMLVMYQVLLRWFEQHPLMDR